MAIVELEGRTLTREEQIEVIMQVTKLPKEDAEFLYALETGEIDGDLIELDGEPPRER